MRKGSLIVVAVVLIALLVACGTSSRPVQPNKGLTIAVIPKGTTHVFWKSVEAGARQAGGRNWTIKHSVEGGRSRKTTGPSRLPWSSSLWVRGLTGSCWLPWTIEPCFGRLEQLPGVRSPSSSSTRGCEQESVSISPVLLPLTIERGGRLAGRRLAELLGGKGAVVLLRYQVGSASTTNREEGFLETLSDYPDIELLVDNQYAGATAGEAIQKSQQLLDHLRRSDGVFCPNESSTYGMLVTLRKNNLAGRLKFVGFDASPELIDALKKGEIQGLVVQNPFRMGYDGVRIVVSSIRGRDVAQRIDTGVELVTRENLSHPAIQKLVGE